MAAVREQLTANALAERTKLSSDQAVQLTSERRAQVVEEQR